jgi:clan AA aspartic protease
VSHPFDANYIPRASVVPVFLAEPDASPAVGPVSALVDTGADGTFVPQRFLDELDLDRTDQVRVHAHFGEARLADVYVVDVVIEERRFPAIEVIADDEDQAVILGRNVLNKLILLLDGPSGVTDVLTHRPIDRPKM